MRAAAQAGTPRPRRQVQVAVMEPACAIRLSKRRSPRQQIFWDVDAFEAAWAQAEWALAERKPAAQTFVDELPTWCTAQGKFMIGIMQTIMTRVVMIVLR